MKSQNKQTLNQDPILTIVVHVHAHYERSLSFILKRIRKLHSSKALEVRVVIHATAGIQSALISKDLSQMSIHTGSSIGRNFGSLLEARRANQLDADLVAHVHTKRSPHIPFRLGSLWFRILLMRTLRGRRSMERIARKVHRDSGIYYPRLDLLFRARSRKLGSPEGKFLKPEVVTLPSEMQSRFSFPAGGMFLADGEMLGQWLDLVDEAKPNFIEHSRVHGEPEHYLERHIGAFFSYHQKAH